MAQLTRTLWAAALASFFAVSGASAVELGADVRAWRQAHEMQIVGQLADLTASGASPPIQPGWRRWPIGCRPSLPGAGSPLGS